MKSHSRTHAGKKSYLDPSKGEEIKLCEIAEYFWIITGKPKLSFLFTWLQVYAHVLRFIVIACSLILKFLFADSFALLILFHKHKTTGMTLLHSIFLWRARNYTNTQRASWIDLGRWRCMSGVTSRRACLRKPFVSWSRSLAGDHDHGRNSCILSEFDELVIVAHSYGVFSYALNITMHM